MRLSERAGKWIEVQKAPDSADELVIRVPGSVWTAWMMDVIIKEEDLAKFLRSLGWKVEIPVAAGRTR